MAGVVVTRRHDLADAQWAALEPLLPAVSGRGRPPKWSRRQLIDGIRWRIRTGAPWRDVPEGYAPWSTLYGRFREHDLYWCGRLLMRLHLAGTVAARVYADRDPSRWQEDENAVDDETDKMTWKTAETVVPALAGAGLLLLGPDGTPADAAALAMTARIRADLIITRQGPDEVA